MREEDLNLRCFGTPRGANRLSYLAKLNLQITHYHIIPKSLAFHSHSSDYIYIFPLKKQHFQRAKSKVPCKNNSDHITHLLGNS